VVAAVFGGVRGGETSPALGHRPARESQARPTLPLMLTRPVRNSRDTSQTQPDSSWPCWP